MRELTYAEFVRAYESVADSWAHLELQPHYGVNLPSPHFAAWRRDEPDDLSYLDPWCGLLSAMTAAGKRLRRLKVVNEPLGEYHRWIHSAQGPIHRAGEVTRWCRRRDVPHVAFPATDYYLLDDSAALFLHFDGDLNPVAYTITEDSGIVALCRTAFAECWAAATDHDEYRPV
ncbi:hypothetical protein GCM10010123_41100 [Pilimelia anulata]|uniref:DUF6879 domain-containing protein n=1 Tax=Pilimelia anulata TaxID=53371 RepID=A0A8J3BDL5_9ACTN|nr:DUF6879 family protein [Pilimelia anulata]GGK07078.1 hypothetical protein GCM10010123_41100 [Pilimelia anulata]